MILSRFSFFILTACALCFIAAPFNIQTAAAQRGPQEVEPTVPSLELELPYVDPSKIVCNTLRLGQVREGDYILHKVDITSEEKVWCLVKSTTLNSFISTPEGGFFLEGYPGGIGIPHEKINENYHRKDNIILDCGSKTYSIQGYYMTGRPMATMEVEVCWIQW